MNVKGLSIKDILNMDFADIQKLSRKELAQVTSRLVSASNKRLKRLEQSDFIGESPAYRYAKSRKDTTDDVRFSVKGKIQGQLQRTFTEAKHFLSLKTSTLAGYKKVIQNIKETIKEKTGREISSIDVSKLYDALHKAQESGLVAGRGTKGSDIAVGYIIDMLESNPEKTVDEIYAEIEDYSSNIYESSFLNEDSIDDYKGWNDVSDNE